MYVCMYVCALCVYVCMYVCILPSFYPANLLIKNTSSRGQCKLGAKYLMVCIRPLRTYVTALFRQSSVYCCSPRWLWMFKQPLPGEWTCELFKNVPQVRRKAVRSVSGDGGTETERMWGRKNKCPSVLIVKEVGTYYPCSGWEFYFKHRNLTALVLLRLRVRIALQDVFLFAFSFVLYIAMPWHWYSPAMCLMRFQAIVLSRTGVQGLIR